MAADAVASPRPARSRGGAAARSPSPAGRAAKPEKAKSTVVAPKGKGKSFGFFGRHGNVYIYIPNLIGYCRVAATAGAFGVAFDSPNLMLMLYVMSFVCDELDGRFARMFNQSTTFGAVLDMVTDRLSTTGLCIVLAAIFPARARFFLGAVALDIGAHWVQMYASLLSKAASHKDVAAASNPLLRLYYQKRVFMGALCIGAEFFYIALYLLSKPEWGFRDGPALGSLDKSAKILGLIRMGFPKVVSDVVSPGKLSASEAILIISFPLWVLKQATNVLQLQFSAKRLAKYG